MLRAARCCGFTRDGAPCRWTAGANFAVTAPLENGGRYCAYHIKQEKTPTGKQLSLIRFLSPADGASQSAAASPRATELDHQAGIDDTQLKEQRRLQEHSSDACLSQAQQDLINANREKAVVRRQLREQKSDSTLSQEQQAKIDENRKKAMERRRLREHSSDANLSDEQHTLINENRQKALERRRLREQKSEASFIDLPSPAPHGRDCPSTPRASSSSGDRLSLTPVQLARIAERRAQAVEKQKIKACIPTSDEVASADLTGADAAQDEAKSNGTSRNSDGFTRSRTPPQKNRRRLYEHTTGTPIARPPSSLGNIAAVHAKSNNFEAMPV